MELKRITEYEWELPKMGEMRVPGRIYISAALLKPLLAERGEGGGHEGNAIDQVKNVASLPGIVKASIAMPDVHPGYGFPIGGVGAFDPDEGVVAMGGVGFDINCGVRVLATPFSRKEVEARKEQVADALFAHVPAGLGSEGKLRLTVAEIDEVLKKGAKFALERGFGIPEDLEYVEEGGRMDGADPAAVSPKAKERQFRQVGTLGSGNHYLEVQFVEEVYDPEAARAYGIERDQILIAIHCGSRALGHQIGQDYLQELERASRKYGIPIRERELVCAPIKSPEGERYLAAVAAGINCAFANRQVIAHLVREALAPLFAIPLEKIRTIYDVGHNNVKFERHRVDGAEKTLLVHRKGSTRAFGPGRPENPPAYRKVGHPIFVGGTMGTASYILHGTEVGMDKVFGSGVHGAGRAMSRVKAKKRWRGDQLVRELAGQGIVVRAHSLAGAAEEAPGAYKDVELVVEAAVGAGLNTVVARVRPLVCIKG
ncbi:MAG: RtcB family protein [Candidatus Acetothermia bacterium]|nr:RtcB family protein [Candidatus Acetothermia bacterium]